MVPADQDIPSSPKIASASKPTSALCARRTRRSSTSSSSARPAFSRSGGRCRNASASRWCGSWTCRLPPCLYARRQRTQNGPAPRGTTEAPLRRGAPPGPGRAPPIGASQRRIGEPSRDPPGAPDQDTLPSARWRIVTATGLAAEGGTPPGAMGTGACCDVRGTFAVRPSRACGNFPDPPLQQHPRQPSDPWQASSTGRCRF